MLGMSELKFVWPVILFGYLVAIIFSPDCYFTCTYKKVILNFVSIIHVLTQSSENTDRLRNGPRRDSFSISFPSAFDNGDGIHRSVKVTI